jgi:hypothetical protein
VDARARRHAFDAAHVVYSATEHGDGASCAGGTDAGRGTLRFAFGTLRFTISEERATAVVHASLTGAGGGSAAAVATPGPATDPATVAQKCAGAGVRRADIVIDLKTTPSMAG